MEYECTGTGMEGSDSGLIEFLSCRAEENHEKYNSEQALFSTRKAVATPPAQSSDDFVLI